MTDEPLAWLVSLEGVAAAFAGARDGIDVMLRDRGLRRTAPDITGESLLRGAHASAVLEGSASTLAEVRESGGDAIARDAVRFSAELLSLVPVLRQTPLQAFARLHALAAAGTLPDGELGRPRGAHEVERLRGLAELLTTDKTTPALIIASIAHADLATVAPFGSHNGIVARAAERLVLVARGVDPTSLVVPEAGHLALREAYESNLRGYASGQRTGIHSWLLYAAEAFTAGAEASPLRREAL
ncbi:hypothetical protein [Nocardioides sp. Iso805N]|uniref:hypothetical protein n=1 Tax=Nocardioides sp. Iso805N TaxID=1283287 RepID=UPI000375E603|nr:hypothetical protein [Nocardioides sp. Iso805N]